MLIIHQAISSQLMLYYIQIFQVNRCKRKLDDRDFCSDGVGGGGGGDTAASIAVDQPLVKRLRPSSIYSPRKPGHQQQGGSPLNGGRPVLEDATLKQINTVTTPQLAGKFYRHENQVLSITQLDFISRTVSLVSLLLLYTVKPRFKRKIRQPEFFS